MPSSRHRVAGNPGDWGEDKRPVAAVSYDLPAGTVLREHTHTRAQLVYAAKGVMVVSTPQGTWVVPPLRAVWVPEKTVHRVETRGRVLMRTLYIVPGLVPEMPDHCCVVHVSDLLRELILHAVSFTTPSETAAEVAVRRVIVDQLKTLPVTPLRLPRPTDRQLLKVVQLLEANPADSRTLAQFGQVVGASSRTLSRRFVLDTGMTFAEWRQQLRLLTAIELLAEGHPVTGIAYRVGYDSPSAFIAMFKRAVGQTPNRYFAGTSGG